MSKVGKRIVSRSINEKKECVYFLLKNDDNPKGYVGSTKDVYSRFRAYKNNSKKLLIEDQIHQFGWDSFQKIIIELNTNSIKELRAWETFYIGLFGTHIEQNPDFGLNQIRDANKGWQSEDRIKEKVSKKLKGINVGIKRPYVGLSNKVRSKKVLDITKNKLYNSIVDFSKELNITPNGAKYRINKNPTLYKLL